MNDTRRQLVETAIQHVKAAAPNTYEEWVWTIIEFTGNVYETDPIRLRDARKRETPLPPPASSVS